MTDAPLYLSGQLLLSMPGIGDRRFDRVVIALSLHDEDGALGVIVNRRHRDVTLRDLMEQLDVEPGGTPLDAPVYVGGPVEPGRGFVLHSLDYGGQGTIQVGDRWALTSTIDVLRAIAAGSGPERWLVALGYSGWAGGQLENELLHHGWQVAPGDPDLLFDAPADQRWPRAFSGLGIDVGHLSPTVGRA